MKIYLNDRVIEFTNTVPDNISDRDIIVQYESPAQLKSEWDLFARYEKHHRMVLPEAAIDSFFGLFKLINAAGGLVKNEKDEMLFIHRNGKWDLPKGKLEAGETPQHAAIREVMEETGLVHVTLVRELSCTYHLYFEKEKWYLKRTWWFEMLSESSQPLVPQSAEGIYLAKWTPLKGVHCILTHTYESIREMLIGFLF